MQVGDWATLSCVVSDHFDSCEWIHVDKVTQKQTSCKVVYKWEWDPKNSHYKDKPTQVLCLDLGDTVDTAYTESCI